VHEESNASHVNVGRQLKAARTLLGWSQTDLAEKSDSSRSTVERIESSGDGLVDYAGHDKAADIIAALECAGSEFIEDAGVKLDKRKRRRQGRLVAG
jgi:transcriptional regulator with XRE-family HTH domain